MKQRVFIIVGCVTFFCFLVALVPRVISRDVTCTSKTQGWLRVISSGPPWKVTALRRKLMRKHPHCMQGELLEALKRQFRGRLTGLLHMNLHIPRCGGTSLCTALQEVCFWVLDVPFDMTSRTSPPMLRVTFAYPSRKKTDGEIVNQHYTA